jgi:hypothetical protein
MDSVSARYQDFSLGFLFAVMVCAARAFLCRAQRTLAILDTMPMPEDMALRLFMSASLTSARQRGAQVSENPNLDYSKLLESSKPILPHTH